jgi:hypothetical protein
MQIFPVFLFRIFRFRGPLFSRHKACESVRFRQFFDLRATFARKHPDAPREMAYPGSLRSEQRRVLGRFERRAVDGLGLICAERGHLLAAWAP